MSDDLAYRVLCKAGDDAAWKASRKRGVSASIIPSLIGANPYEKRSYSQIIEDLATGLEIPDNPNMWLGRCLEKHVIEYCNKAYGLCAVEWQELCQSRQWPWLLATPDARVADEVIVEVKVHGPAGRSRWSAGPPEMHVIQVHTQAAVTGYRLATIVECETGKWPKLWPVEIDELMIRDIVAASERAHIDIIRRRAELGIGEDHGISESNEGTSKGEDCAVWAGGIG